MINDDYDYEYEEDLMIQAAVAGAIAAGFCALEYAKRMPRSAELDLELEGVKESLDTISNSLHEFASEGKFLRRAPEQRGNAYRRQKAMERVQEIETHLDAPRVVALSDLVATDTMAAVTYMAIKRDDLRHAWVAEKLKEMGFVDGISI